MMAVRDLRQDRDARFGPVASHSGVHTLAGGPQSQAGLSASSVSVRHRSRPWAGR